MKCIHIISREFFRLMQISIFVLFNTFSNQVTNQVIILTVRETSLNIIFDVGADFKCNGVTILVTLVQSAFFCIWRCVYIHVFNSAVVCCNIISFP